MKKKYYTFKVKLYFKILKWYKDYFKNKYDARDNHGNKGTLLTEDVNLKTGEVDYYMKTLHLIKISWNNENNNEIRSHYNIDNMEFWRERFIKNIVLNKVWYQEALKYIDIPPVTICIDGCSISNKPEDQIINKFDVYA